MSGAPSSWSIFRAFFAAGASAYGGPAMMPTLRAEVVDKRKLVSREEFNLGLGLCQTIPGGTLMQLAAYIGLTRSGLPGAIAGYLGFSAPAFILITLLSTFYAQTRSLPIALAVFAGLKVVVLAICLMSCLDFVKRFAPTRRHQAFTAGAAALFLAGVGVVPIIFGAAALGMLFLDPGPAPEKGHDTASTASLKLAGAIALAQLLFMAGLYLWDRQLFDLALSMIKVDLLAFGGFGVFPVMYAEVVTHHAWLDEQTFLDGMALAQVTPGPTLLASAFVGYILRGVQGAIVASVGIFAASFVIILAAAHYRERIIGSLPARKALAGVLATLGGMIVAVSVSFAKAVPWGWPATILLALTLAALVRKVPAPIIVLGGAALSMLLF